MPNLSFLHSIAKIPNDTATCNVYILGNGSMEFQILDKVPSNLSGYKKISGSSYVNKSTGEVHPYTKSSHRMNNPDVIKKSFSTLRRTILANIVGDGSEVHAVLTFSTSEFIYQNLYPSIKNFIARLRYRYPAIEYIAVPEPHNDSSFHIHLILKNRDGSRLFIPHAELSDIWGNGRVWVRRIVKDDRIAAYLTSVSVNSNDGGKGAQLRYYPSYGRLYRCSRGIKKVYPLKMNYKQAKDLIGNRHLTFAKTIHVMRNNADDTQTELNAITYERYSLKTNIEDDSETE